MVKWNVTRQESGITNRMRRFGICKNIGDWLEQTYGGYWCVIIGTTGELNSCFRFFDKMYLCIQESDLNWMITIFKQST
ncbi:unnamed protein product [Rotaria magnacalcarata]